MIPLKVTTDYSMMKSMITIPHLMEYLEKKHIKVCGICDENLYGVMEFYDTCLSHEIKPLIGLELKVNDMILYAYAKDYHGYLELLQIHTKKEKNELTLFDLEASQHIAYILPYLFMKQYNELKNKMKYLYIGYQTEYEKNNAYLVTEKVVFCPDLKCFRIDDSYYLNLLQAIDHNESLKLMNQVNYEKNSFEYYEQDNTGEDKTNEFIEGCNVSIPKENRYIPHYDAKIEDSFAYLVALAKKGLDKRLNHQVSDEYMNRLNYELSVIQKMGFADYFLIVYDYVKFAKTHGILVGAGRGSAVGSLVSYSLGITDVNPLEYHLLFERFLNPERVTMPDIDIDFEETRRDEVVSYVKKRYGLDCVANIMTFGTLKSKLVLRSVGKSLDMNPQVIDSFVNKIDPKLTLKDNLLNKDIAYYAKNNQDIREMMRVSLKLEGLKKHISTHAAGVVISSVPLDHVIPIHLSGDEVLTGVTMNYLEDLGLLKMDFLALRNLTIIQNILDLIKENTGKEVDLNHIDLNDKKVLELFQKADTVGVFQFESEGMKNFLKRMQPTTFLDIVSAIALYRPGPMENIDTFIKRKNGKEKITYLHPDLEGILKETYGIIVYQEQVMQILVKMGGFSFAEADIIRRAMSKKKKDYIVQSEKKFIEGSTTRGYNKDLAQEVYDLILKFANYGFNKSHSVSYSVIGFQMAYLKCYYPVYFTANLLNMNMDSEGKTREYLGLAKTYGIQILRPDINESMMTYTIHGNELRLPLSIIHNLGMEAVKSIVSNRGDGYVDYFDFVARTYGKSVNKKTIEALIKAGALDAFGNHPTLLFNMDNAINYATLASGLTSDLLLKPTIDVKEDESEDELRREEQESFGFYLSNHPASKYMDPSIMKLDQIKEHFDQFVKCVVLIDRIKVIKTKKNDDMAFVSASDETGSMDFVIFPSVMKELEGIEMGNLVVMQGKVARRFADYQINVNKIDKINEE